MSTIQLPDLNLYRPIHGNTEALKQGPDRLSTLPSELVLNILKQADSTTSDYVCKRFKELNDELILSKWNKTEKLLQDHPIGAAYLAQVPLVVSPRQKFKILYQEMTGGGYLPPHKSSDQIINPKHYLRMADELRDLDSHSLSRAWPTMREQLIVDGALNLPNADADIVAINNWLANDENQAVIQSVEGFWVELSHMAITPMALQRFTGLKHLHLNRVRLLVPSLLTKLPHLETFRCSGKDGAYLKKIPSHFFAPASKLRRIRLNDNELKDLPPDFCEYNERLEFLELQDNKFQSIPMSLYRLSSQRINNRIRLNGNKIPLVELARWHLPCANKQLSYLYTARDGEKIPLGVELAGLYLPFAIMNYLYTARD
jgi:hypothetical protein